MFEKAAKMSSSRQLGKLSNKPQLKTKSDGCSELLGRRQRKLRESCCSEQLASLDMGKQENNQSMSELILATRY
jgi:hypothetical protein